MRGDEAYALGEDVTALVAGKRKEATAVLSVRLPAEELAEIEAASLSTGKTLSQLVREAVRSYMHAARYSQPVITVSIEGGGTFSTGATSQSSGPVREAQNA